MSCQRPSRGNTTIHAPFSIACIFDFLLLLLWCRVYLSYHALCSSKERAEKCPRYSSQTIYVLKNGLPSRLPNMLCVAKYTLLCMPPSLQGTRNGHTATWLQLLGTTFLSGWCSSTAVSSVPTRRCCGRISQPSSFVVEFSILNLTTWSLNSVIRYPMPACFPSPSFPPSKLLCNILLSAQSFFLQ